MLAAALRWDIGQRSFEHFEQRLLDTFAADVAVVEAIERRAELADELERRVDAGEAVLAFSLYPTTIAQLMDVADAGLLMPPKSTWFEPKLRDAMFSHLI